MGPILQLVRHAESANNALYNALVAEQGGAAAVKADVAKQQRVDDLELKQRSPDPSLSERGFEQAELVATLLGNEHVEASPTILVVSPMLRACLTAEPIAKKLRATGAKENLKVICHAEYYETGGCHDRGLALPGRTFSEITDAHPSLAPTESVAFPKGGGGFYSKGDARETKDQAEARAERLNLWITETLAELPDSGRLILVGHGLVMATLITRLLGLPFSGAPCMATHANTGVSNLRYVRDKGAFLLESLNDTRHVSADAREKGLLTGCDAYRDGWAAALPTPSWDLHRFSPLVGRGVLFPRLPPELRQQTLAMRADGLWANEEGVTAADYEESDLRCETIVATLTGLVDRAIGHVQYDPATKRLRQLFVMPQFRKLGVGSALVKRVLATHEDAMRFEAEDPQKRRRGEGLRVHAHVKSEKFYEKCGFVREGDEYRSNGVMCVRMLFSATTPATVVRMTPATVVVG